MFQDFRTYQLAVAFYRQCQLLKLDRHLKDQLHRASASVALNIAEGAGKSSRADQARFFDIALGSLRESQAALDLANLVNHPVAICADKLGAHLYRLIASCRS